MISNADRSHVTNAAKSHGSLAILRRLLGVSIVQLPFGTRDGAEIFLHQREGFRLVELASDHEHDVIGLVELLVKGAQVIDWHALDVAAVANGRFAVVMPLI